MVPVELPAELPLRLGVKPAAETGLGAPNDGVNPVEGAVFGTSKEGVNPVEAAMGFGASAPFAAPNEGTNPDVLEALGAAEPVEALNEGVNPVVVEDLEADGPTDALKEGVKPVLVAAAFCDSDALFSGAEPLFPIAFENRLEVAVAGGLDLGVLIDADGFGVGVAGSAGRVRFDDDS